jgi:hypothetical protein
MLNRLLFLILFANPILAQQKCSPLLLQHLAQCQPGDSIQVQVYADTISTCRILDKKQKIFTVIVAVHDWSAFISQSSIRFVERLRQPHIESYISTPLSGTNHINALHSIYPQFTGEGATISIKEECFDTADIDLLDKYIPSAIAAASISTHATTMATLISGIGNSSPNSIGVAPAASLSSADFANLLPDDITYFRQFNIHIQNHSYGTDIENYYGIDAATYDEQANVSNDILHVFSSGNIGTNTVTSGIYAGITGYANLSGNFKQAKNVLVVGGVTNTNSTPNLSSKGPAYDGRIKPELMAYGESGTSDASAVASGVVAIVQQAYQHQYGTVPPSALVKTILINSADNDTISYSSGYGIINALEAVNTITQKHIINGTITSDSLQYLLPISDTTDLVKITLGWNDPAAVINARKALVNDLDLSVINTDGTTIFPWILDPTPANLKNAATRGLDTLNNQEQVSLHMTSPGKLIIKVKANHLTTPQNFHIAYHLTPKGCFDWQYPTAAEQLISGSTAVIRWQTRHTGYGNLYYSTDSGRTWINIDTHLQLNGNGCNWNLPSLFTTALLKMETTDTTWISPYFTISPAIPFNTGFACADSALIYWKTQKDVASYDIYHLTGNKLQLFTRTSDTAFIIHNTANPNFTIRPVHSDGWVGVRSYTTDYQQQGVACYFSQLQADITADDAVQLTASLGSLYQLEMIYWERLENNAYIILDSTAITNGFTYTYNDIPDHSGISYYNIRLKLQGGAAVSSGPLRVQVLRNSDFQLFPNPVSSSFNILSRDIYRYDMRLTDLSGRAVMAKPLTSYLQKFSISNIPAGIYICSIYKGNEKVFVKKIIIK